MLIYLAISFLTRTALLVQVAGSTSLDAAKIFGIFAVGLMYDLFVSTLLAIPVVIYCWLMNERMYARPWVLPISAFFLVLLGLVIFTGIVPREFNVYLHAAVVGLLIFHFLKFLFLSYKGAGFRLAWRKFAISIALFFYIFLLVFNAVSEWFFWNEFSTRYNFIAVDYLVYTTEVIGNIRESYPVVWIMVAASVLSLVILMLTRKVVHRSIMNYIPFRQRSALAIVLLALPVLGYYAVKPGWKHFSDNAYANELAGNGFYDFAMAFQNNELDYYRFYTHLADEEAFRIVRKQLESPYSRFVSNDQNSIERDIDYPGQPNKMNIVLISVESLSASFMNSFGSDKNITPCLDSLAGKSMFFTNLYSSGTRTVRGLEALSLSIPPTPGQSVVKRPNNGHLFTLGSVLRNQGYISQYIYGGYSYFDNMGGFFGGNEYQVIDRNSFDPGAIHYSNIWGVADEDLFDHTLKVLDRNYGEHKPFFTHVMTVSNHRPYTYPEGRIDIPPSRQVREGAVKYTDYAIGRFLHEAAGRPWFNQTLFVIVADHCAGSAGSVDLPVTGYHIPLMIYSPANLPPQRIDRLMAQIDIPPTILGLLSIDYRSKFFGRDIFCASPQSDRAFVSTYEGLGYLKADRLVIQSPVNNVEEVIPNFKTGNAQKTMLTDSLVKEAIAWYQCASWMLKNNRYGNQ